MYIWRAESADVWGETICGHDRRFGPIPGMKGLIITVTADLADAVAVFKRLMVSRNGAAAQVTKIELVGRVENGYDVAPVIPPG